MLLYKDLVAFSFFTNSDNLNLVIRSNSSFSNQEMWLSSGGGKGRAVVAVESVTGATATGNEIEGEEGGAGVAGTAAEWDADGEDELNESRSLSASARQPPLAPPLPPAAQPVIVSMPSPPAAGRKLPTHHNRSGRKNM